MRSIYLSLSIFVIFISSLGNANDFVNSFDLVKKNMLLAQQAIQMSLEASGSLEDLSRDVEFIFKEKEKSRRFAFRFINEIKNKFDLSDEDQHSLDPFVHLGRPTWIETDFKPFAPIRVKSQLLFRMIDRVDIDYFILLLAHEISHHLQEAGAESESKEFEANQLAIVIRQFVQERLPFYGLTQLFQGEFRSPLGGCRDRLSVSKIDLKEGSFLMSLATSVGHCPSFDSESSMSFRDLEKQKWPFDSAEWKMLCRIEDVKLVCYPKSLQSVVPFCRHNSDGLEVQEPVFFMAREFRVYVEEGGDLSTFYFWCAESLNEKKNPNGSSYQSIKNLIRRYSIIF